MANLWSEIFLPLLMINCRMITAVFRKSVFDMEKLCTAADTGGKLLGTEKCRSKIECTLRCFQDSNCETFIYTGESMSASLLVSF